MTSQINLGFLAGFTRTRCFPVLSLSSVLLYLLSKDDAEVDSLVDKSCLDVRQGEVNLRNRVNLRLRE